ncbi:ABC transporter ATP-binding protein [Tranquillimonas alkanivorans]|uniref:ATP-binding cassette, subfamily B n=1 Tax=Tranquillimonas alkanivorans TaxID=441119 RepID=A0A1I5LFH9_9RHOB|nr:ABC transporter ATP-binding protein [Tranquillimonas alkanivorans]SFO96038.1 ATP-binding cassette, subfamily B [Tranquillimonas alkanivorans]
MSVSSPGAERPADPKPVGRLKRLADVIDAFRPADGPPPRTLFAFFRWTLAGSWKWLWIAGGLSAAAGTAEVVTAVLLGEVIDAALASGPAEFVAENLWFLVGTALFFLALRPILFGLSAGSNSIIVAPNVNPLVLTRLHRWTLGQSVTFFDDDFAGRIAQKQMQTSRAITDVASEVINVVFFALASLIGSALLLTTINVWMALALAVWVVAYLSLIRWFMPRVRRRSMARAASRAMVSGQVVDTITNIKTVKLFAHADHEDQAAIDAIGSFRERVIDFGVLSAGFRFALMSLAGILPVLLVGGTLALWANGAATPGDIAAAGAIAIRIAQMTGWVSFTLMAIYANVGEVEDGMNTLTPPHTLTDKPDAVELSQGGDVRFDRVSFAYGRQSGGVQNIDLTIRQGEKLGIVGASGAGKSTLVALLLRLYDPEEGTVSIAGHSVGDVTQESLRRRIGMVTQETAMFNRSARDNIRYGRPNATEDEMVAAAKKAEAHDFILDLVDFKGRTGYDAHLGERGVKLSGGQRQRIALARAILKDAPILVLDEATSALDSEVEASIQAALDRVMEGKTVLAIAHRLSTIARMDRIIVLEDGHIVEQGTHDDLLAQEGVYARYWHRQSGGFINFQDAAE